MVNAFYKPEKELTPPTQEYGLRSKVIRVLCADDDPTILNAMRLFMGRVFSDREYLAVFVGNGQDALNAVSGCPFEQLIHEDRSWKKAEGVHYPFDIAFTDNSMPFLTGAQFAEECSQMGTKKPPIVLVSSDELPGKSLAGVDRVAKKPLTCSEFKEIIESHVGSLS